MSRHGLSSTRVYKTWIEIKRRCYNIKSTSYLDYGGRGISFEEYKDNFLAFLEEVGNPPSELHSINRINNELGYIKGNMEWALISKQVRNRRKLKNNTSGVTGVALRKVKNNEYFIAQWYDLNGKSNKKYFSIRKYGKSKAFKQACEFRAKKIIELNEKGAGYAEQHGK